MAEALAPLIESGSPTVVLCAAESRLALKELTSGELPRLVVLSYPEVPRDIPVDVIGTAEVEGDVSAMRSTTSVFKS